jgi:hypothetical protein
MRAAVMVIVRVMVMVVMVVLTLTGWLVVVTRETVRW